MRCLMRALYWSLIAFTFSTLFVSWSSSSFLSKAFPVRYLINVNIYCPSDWIMSSGNLLMTFVRTWKFNHRLIFAFVSLSVYLLMGVNPRTDFDVRERRDPAFDPVLLFLPSVSRMLSSSSSMVFSMTGPFSECSWVYMP